MRDIQDLTEEALAHRAECERKALMEKPQTILSTIRRDVCHLFSWKTWAVALGIGFAGGMFSTFGAVDVYTSRGMTVWEALVWTTLFWSSLCMGACAGAAVFSSVGNALEYVYRRLRIPSQLSEIMNGVDPIEALETHLAARRHDYWSQYLSSESSLSKGLHRLQSRLDQLQQDRSHVDACLKQDDRSYHRHELRYLDRAILQAKAQILELVEAQNRHREVHGKMRSVHKVFVARAKEIPEIDRRASLRRSIEEEERSVAELVASEQAVAAHALEDLEQMQHEVLQDAVVQVGAAVYAQPDDSMDLSALDAYTEDVVCSSGQEEACLATPIPED